MSAIAATPVEPLTVVIGTFNRVFERNLDPDFAYTRTQLDDMSFFAADKNQPWLAFMLKRHAENAEKIV